ncbi:MAG: tubulin-like doman-containing protein [Planctomycetota bacterium]
MLQTPHESQKEILGYQLIERIGSGGFGEVWSATAPGGLKKALKIVHGYHDGRRAKAELKALGRVKELRHPFLLSLERIEVFEGQLIVVSELADCSLADLYNRYASKGEQGIPRDEMLKYLRCAAEALDYLSDEHNLQHLDVKPENLLLVGSHVKVADFGLIKDLQQASQSLMSGMTPAYAAPELFDGRPVSNSDQYSLAIVYQEMLSGVRPFPGNTPAQLAAQHMHGKPNLSSLTRLDQPIIAKALSKDPKLRFRNCRELADELSNQRRAVKKAIRRQTFSRESTDTESKTINIDPGHGHDVTAIITDKALPFLANEIKVLPPPACDGEKAELRPTFVVGLGSTGSKIVQKIKGLLTARYTSMDEIPAIKLLAIDTDRNALGQLRRDKGHGSLNNTESLEVPLRKPEGYRKRAQSHLNWLSRRWIYNVPRSLQTEGLRPLGRLAFADHFDSICDRIQDAIRGMATEEALAKSADTLNMDPGELAPRVFVVSSVSGGVGSGMTLDLSYTVKLLLHECGLPAESVVGVLLHSTYQRYRDPGLSAANAFALLTEMRHFVENGFPGDPSIGMPDFGEQPPFDYTYFNDLGNDLCQSEFEGKLDRVAEYILLSSTSKCAPFFDECRDLESEIEHFSLRTFGLSMTGPGNLDAGTHAIRRVGKGLIRRWLSAEGDGSIPNTVLVDRVFDEQGLELSKLGESISKRLDNYQPFDRAMNCGNAFEAILANPGRAKSVLQEQADSVFGCPHARRDATHVEPEHCMQLEDEIGSWAQEVGEFVTQIILDQMDGHSMNLGFAHNTAKFAIEKIKSIGKELDQLVIEGQETEKQVLSLLSKVSMAKVGTVESAREDLASIVGRYMDQRQREFVNRYKRHFFRVASSSLSNATASLARYVSQIEMIDNEFNYIEDISSLTADECSLDMNRLLNESVETETSTHILATENLVYEHLIKPRGGYLQTLDEPSAWQGQLGYEVRTQAQRVLTEAYKKASIQRVVNHHNIEPERMVRWLNERMVEAKPSIDNCGGATRLLVAVPEYSEDDELQSSLEKHFSVEGCSIRGTQGNFVLCFEGEDISLANVAYRLLQARPDAIELVKRIHTRSDIDWVTLDDLL